MMLHANCFLSETQRGKIDILRESQLPTILPEVCLSHGTQEQINGSE